jgi:capsular polysaccharide transport system ATP-binding protein
VDYKPLVPFVEEFTELGVYFREPVSHYSTGMITRLAFALSMAIEFDCFLIDEVVAVGDERFHQKCHHELFEQRKDRAMILVSHNMSYISQHCDRAAILQNGSLTMFNDIGAASEAYNQMNC